MRQTLDIGIDLGTTNSVVAIVDNGRAYVLKDDYDNQELLPSYVAFHSDGSVHCGASARNTLLTDPENAFEGFKRLMGTAWKRSAPATGVSYGPEELAGLILQELRRRAAQWLNEEPTEAVITIPAVFGEVEKHAVTRAAQLAAFLNVTLVQEPVAAGLAYGWDKTSEERPFLVYDIGGGTFDACLMQCVGGQLIVLGHLGEHTLGGRDMDDAIADQIVAPRLAGKIAPGELNRMALRLCCEDAKKRLSSLPSTPVQLSGSMVRSVDGQAMDDVIPITLNELELVVLPKIDQTIDIILRLLADAGVKPLDLASVILVGGPTRMPVLRRRLEESLGAPIVTRLDPMTVVAQGAALYAASIPRSAPSGDRSQRVLDATQIKLAFDPVTSQPSLPVGVAAGDSAFGDGTTVRFRRLDGLWDSGLVKLLGGKGIVHVMLADSPVSVFGVELFGPGGESILVEPETFQVRRGLAAAPPPLSRAIGVVVEEMPDSLSRNDRFSISIIANRGEPTPFTHRAKFFTTKPLTPGSTEPVLNVGFFEGPAHEERNIRKERFRKIGIVPISGTDLDRPLPVGTEVEITVRVEASHEAVGRVYVPSIAKYFEGNLFEFELRETPSQEDLEFRLNQLTARLDDLEEASVDVKPLKARMQEARHEIEAVRSGGMDSEARAVTVLEGIELDADTAEEQEAPRLALEELDRYLALAGEIVTNYGDPEHLRRLNQLKLDAERARSRQNVEEARSVRARLLDLAGLVYWNQPGAWVQRFQELAAFDEYLEAEQASGLIQRGRNALEVGDLDMLKRVVLDLISLSPQTNEPGPWTMFGGIARAR